MRYFVCFLIFFTALNQAGAQNYTKDFPWDITYPGQYTELTSTSKAFYKAIIDKNWDGVANYVPHSDKARASAYYDPLLAARYRGNDLDVTPANAIQVEVNGNKGFLLTMIYKETADDPNIVKSVQVWVDLWFLSNGKWQVLAGSALNVNPKLEIDFRAVDGWMVTNGIAVLKEKEQQLLEAKQEEEYNRMIQEHEKLKNVK